jgi:hypothetical protein
MFTGDTELSSRLTLESTEEMTVNERACAIGKIVAVCKYMSHEETVKRLKLTVNGISTIL